MTREEQKRHERVLAAMSDDLICIKQSAHKVLDSEADRTSTVYLTTVLVRGGNGIDCAAYQGATVDPDLPYAERERLARGSGRKMRLHEAIGEWPGLTDMLNATYRF